MASGLLTGAMTHERAAKLPKDDWRRASSNFNEPKLSRNIALAERLREIGKRYGRSPGEVAIAWTLTQPSGDRRHRGRSQCQPGRRRHARRGARPQ